jgi:hypothetical protein
MANVKISDIATITPALTNLMELETAAGASGKAALSAIQSLLLTGLPIEIGIAASDETTDLTTGTAKATFRMPYDMTLTDVRASLTTATTGANLIVDINQNGSSVLSTEISIDATETSSVTAATPPVISTSALTDNAVITIDIDQIGSGDAGAGLKVWLIGTRA